MSPPRRQTRPQPRTRVLLLILVALGLHVLYTPFHLATEEHLGVRGRAIPQAAGGGRHADPDHEHEGNHVLHSALDHPTDLIVRRSQFEHRTADLNALLVHEGVLLRTPSASPTSAPPEPEPSKARARLAPRPRAPPAAA